MSVLDRLRAWLADRFGRTGDEPSEAESAAEPDTGPTLDPAQATKSRTSSDATDDAVQKLQGLTRDSEREDE